MDITKPGDGSNLTLMNKTSYCCAICSRVEEDERQVLFCDYCQRWFHFICEGVDTTAKEEDDWTCKRCRERSSLEPAFEGFDSATGGLIANSDEDEEITKAMKAMQIEKERLRKKMQHKLELEQAKLELEHQKREMQWAMEKKVLEMRIAAETAFKQKQNAEKKKLEQQLNSLREDRECPKVDKKKKKKAVTVAKSKKLHKKIPIPSSTPVSHTGSSSSLGASKKKQSVNSSTPLQHPDEPDDPVEDDPLDPDDPVDPVDPDDPVDDEDSNEEDGDEEDDDEDDDPVVLPDKPVKRPTKAQMSARQFLSRKLPVFTGKPDEWPLFISSFNTTTEACGFSNLENLARLQESLRGPARDAVGSRLLLPEAVPQIIESLRMLYGRPELLLNTMLAKVRRSDSPKAERPGTFVSFGMIVQQLCDHLEATNLNDHLVNPLLIQELVEKLPASTKMEWVRFKRQQQRVTLRTLADFLSELVSTASEVTATIDIHPGSSGPKAGKPKGGKQKEYEGHVNAHTGTESTGNKQEQIRTPCPTCNRTDHRLRNCETFRKMDVEERWIVVKRFNLCQCCLNAHGSNRCKANIQCKVDGCQGSHNTMLHQRTVVLRSDCNTHSDGSQQPIIFRMVPVNLSYGGKTITTTAFLDEGSSYTLVESSLTKRLKATGKPQPLRVSWTAGIVRVERDSEQLNLTIAAIGSTESFPLEKVHTVEELKLPVQSIDHRELAKRFNHLRSVPITDYPNDSPGILIGLKHLHLFAPLEARVGNAGEPIAVRSKLGWTVYGPQENSGLRSTYVGHHSCVGMTNQELYEALRTQYVDDDAGVSVEMLPESAEERRGREILERTTTRIGDRFVTGLLWREDNPSFPDNYSMAARRMKALEKRMSQNPQLYENVRGQIVDYQRKGYCHKARQDELASTDPTWYLPINIVMNPKKPHKVRLVWDAAAAVGGVSLNSKLLKGPDFLTSLPSVICQFREHRIGFGGDIREMFHQVQIRPEDKQVQRFLFDGEVYVMDCAIFGASCSPSQALYVKDRNASEFASQFPAAAEAIVKRHYVDDYFDSTATVEEAVKKAKEVRFVHSKAGFEIRNWVSNSVEVLRQLGESETKQTIHFNKDKSSDYERVLGVVWQTTEDVFTFSMRMREDLFPYLYEDKCPTKRVVLSSVMSLYDPLGLLALFTVHGKTLIQDLWRTGCEWDEPIDSGSLEKWRRWTALLPTVEQVKIPRYHFGDGVALDYKSLQLHVFVDASDKAYGCAAYFRILASGVPRCSLVQARSKVAPIKLHSIPRLELMAAVLGARLVQTVKENHNLQIHKVHLWTDSRTVHSWIASDQRKYKTFVAFRIGEIISKTKVSDWRWIPTRLNIADELTKWNKGPQLQPGSPWFAGPKFLYQDESSWPQAEPAVPNVKEEIRTVFLHHAVEQSGPWIDVSRVSKWSVLVRTVACVRRFVSNIRRKQKGLEIETIPVTPKIRRIVRRSVPAIERYFTRDELQEAERDLWRLAQNEAFADETIVLRRRREEKDPQKWSIDRSSGLFKLSPILDEYNVIRMEGRVAEAEGVPFELRFPVILPKGHEVTNKIIEYYHQQFGHSNRETVVNEVRQRFYIPAVRTELKKITKLCVWCKVHKCRPVFPRMAPLPTQRVTPFLRPFSHTGVDFFGPIAVTVGRHTEKRWGVLFTCFSTRAIHLEVAHSLSSQSCLMAIRRFVCRRGIPLEYFSDNGTNFVGACKEVIKRIESDCCQEFTSSRSAWNFNPPSAPHFGGVWERLVRLVKEGMEVLNDGRSLTDEVLLTTMAEIEDMVNSRPLTYVSSEAGNVESITPNHFVRGLPSTGNDRHVPPTNEAEALRDRYKRSQMLADQVWKRWVTEYLPTVNHRSKWHAESIPLDVGEIVYVADEGNRKCWVRGVVEQVIKGTDGRIRQAMVRTNKGVFRRPVAKLAVPEVRSCKSGSGPESPPELRGGAVGAPLNAR